MFKNFHVCNQTIHMFRFFHLSFGFWIRWFELNNWINQLWNDVRRNCLFHRRINCIFIIIHTHIFIGGVDTTGFKVKFEKLYKPGYVYLENKSDIETVEVIYQKAWGFITSIFRKEQIISRKNSSAILFFFCSSQSGRYVQLAFRLTTAILTRMFFPFLALALHSAFLILLTLSLSTRLKLNRTRLIFLKKKPETENRE